MGDRTGIAWTDATWNPVRGCSRQSEGCRFCFAERIAARFSGPGQAYEGFADAGRHGSKWTGRVELLPRMLDQVLRWKRPRRIFVNSMSDLFHPELSFDDAIDPVFGVMALAHWHEFQVLTKRSDRMLEWATRTRKRPPILECVTAVYVAWPELAEYWPFDLDRAVAIGRSDWPLRNVHMGASVEHQAAADERVPLLIRTPAAYRFLSLEPLIGRVDLCQALGMWQRQLGPGRFEWVREFDKPPIDQFIVGGESGPGARPMRRDWAESLLEQARSAGAAFFFKQVGSHRVHAGWPPMLTGKGDDPEVWPEHLRVQEFATPAPGAPA